MEKYPTQLEAIIDLHERGFSNDFELFGNDLLWIQGKIFVRTGEFCIVEYHRVGHPMDETDVLVFGVVAISHGIKGILISHYTAYTDKTPPVIVKKLNELERMEQF